MRVLAVDDERPALEDLARMLRSLPAVTGVECALSGAEALRKLGEGAFDAVFLDVRMPGLDGLELGRVLRRFERPPPVVFVSAYESGAVGAFEVQALDYLMKPVSRARLREAIERVQADRGQAAEGDEVVPVAAGRGGRTRLVRRESIFFLEAKGDYVRIVTEDGRFLTRARISELEQRWQDHAFVRVHRGYVANMRRAVEIRPLLNGTARLVFPGGLEVPVARRKVNELRRRLAV